MIDPAVLHRELAFGFEQMALERDVVTVFGSSRFSDTHPYYAMAREVGRCLGSMGFTVLTGGGPGLMEAANRGAKDAGARSIGCTIKKTIGPERDPRGNAWCDAAIPFDTFSARKAVMIFHSQAFVILPGGYGTMDELFEVLTLRQTHKLPDLPIVLMGEDYWSTTLDMLRQSAAVSAVTDEDIAKLVLTDDLSLLRTMLPTPLNGARG